MTNGYIKPVALFFGMMIAAYLSFAMSPDINLESRGTPKLNLEAMVPKTFGDWRVDENIVPIAPSPDLQAELDKSYDQILSRTYVNSRGQRVMLSLAYGGDYSKKVMQYHRPEICYPSQGFEILARKTGDLDTVLGSIPVVRLYAKNGARHEPVTYWITVASEATQFGLGMRWIQLKSSLTGQVPDGILVRFSTISPDVSDAYAIHDAFAKELLIAMQPADAIKLTGKLNP